MRKKWILIALSAGLLAAMIAGGAALAWGGPGKGGIGGWFGGDNDRSERQTAVANKVANILGTDAQTTADAIERAHREVQQEAADAKLQDLAARVAEILETDADATADAINNAGADLSREALDRKLQRAIDNGRMTEDEAQEIRDQAETNGWHTIGHGLHAKGDFQELANRVGETLNVDGDTVAAALKQAFTDMHIAELDAKLDAAVENGRITQAEADEIRAKMESNHWRGYGKAGHGRHGHGRR